MAKGKGIKINIGAVGAEKTRQAIQKVSVTTGGLVKAMAPLAAAAAGVKLLGAAFNKIGESVDAFNVQAAAVDKLNASLRRAGYDAKTAAAAQLEFASALQVATGVGDETTIALQAQALALGVSKNDLNDTTQAAVGLSKALGIDLDSAMQKTIEVMKGNTNAFGDLIPEMYGVTDPMQRLAIINDLAAQGMQTAGAETQTLRGTMNRLSGATGDLMERFGELLEPLLKVVNTGMAAFIEALNGGLQPAIDKTKSIINTFAPIVENIGTIAMQVGQLVGFYISAAVNVIGEFATMFAEVAGSSAQTGSAMMSIFTMVRDTIVKTITFVEVVLLNLPQVFDLVVASSKLALLSLVLDIKHFFTVEIPAYAVWFADNFVNILRDGFVGAFTIVKNFITNMSEAFNVLFQYLSGDFVGGWEGVTTRLGDIASKSLLEGFEAQTAALPDIAARQMSAGEQRLTAEINGIATNLGDQYNKKLTERMGKFSEMPGFEGLDFGGVNFGLRTGQGMGMGKSATQLQASESRLMTRGPNQDPFQQRMLRAFEQIAKNTEATAKNTEADTETSPGETDLSFEVIP